MPDIGTHGPERTLRISIFVKSGTKSRVTSSPLPDSGGGSPSLIALRTVVPLSFDSCPFKPFISPGNLTLEVIISREAL